MLLMMFKGFGLEKKSSEKVEQRRYTHSSKKREEQAEADDALIYAWLVTTFNSNEHPFPYHSAYFFSAKKGKTMARM